MDEKINPSPSILLLNIDESLTPLIALAENANQSWTILEDKFDRKTVTNLHSLLKSIFNLKCTSKREVAAHIAEYDELWQRFTVRTRAPAETDSKEEPLEKLLKPLAESDRAKGAFFLTSLPASLDYVVKNLTTKPSITYTDICNKLQDLFPASSNAASSQSAFAATDSKPENRRGRGSDRVCNYCKSIGRPGLGHTEEDCWKKELDEWKQVKQQGEGKQIAAVVVEPEQDDGNYAFATSGSKTLLPTDRWILDTAATSHMTPNWASIENARPTNRMVTVGGGYQLQATEIGSAKLTTLLSNGTTRTITLNDTLVVPELHFPLISWPRMAEAGQIVLAIQLAQQYITKGKRFLRPYAAQLAASRPCGCQIQKNTEKCKSNGPEMALMAAEYTLKDLATQRSPAVSRRAMETGTQNMEECQWQVVTWKKSRRTHCRGIR